MDSSHMSQSQSQLAQISIHLIFITTTGFLQTLTPAHPVTVHTNIYTFDIYHYNCDSSQALSPALKSHPDIHHLGLSIQLVLKLFVCQTCKIALTGDNIGNHLHNFHNIGVGIHVDAFKIR